MRSFRPSLRTALTLSFALAIWPTGTHTGPVSSRDTKARPSYTSHYLVFGTRDAAGTPRLLALDFNRTRHGPNRVAYEYKLFVARGGRWSMPVYETWTAATARGARFPTRGGLTPTLTEAGLLRRVRADLPGLTLEVVPKHPTFPFPKEKTAPSSARTGHPQFIVRWNGTTYRGPGVYEWIRSGPSSRSRTAEERRKLDEEASFGLYDWIVLYDENGRLWQISQGTLTADFAYQQATEALPAETHDVLVRWLATEYDKKAGLHSPTAWLVDVPAWGMRVKLRKQGEHRGHGPLQDDGTRPIYVQATVTGHGLIQGKEHQFFGMVEHIRD